MRRLLSRAGIAAVILLTAAQSAEAHIVASRLGDFYAGALHPLTDLQDDVLWTALGLLAGSLGATHGRWLVLVLPLGSLRDRTGVGFDARRCERRWCRRHDRQSAVWGWTGLVRLRFHHSHHGTDV